MYSLGNVNHDISVVGYWIFDSNYKEAFVLNRKLLGMIFAPYFHEETVSVFDTVFTSVR